MASDKTVMVKSDPRDIVRNMTEEQVRMLALELMVSWPHAKECACIKVSVLDEDKGSVLVTSTDEDCDCGADLRLSKHIEFVQNVYPPRSEE